MERWYGIRFNMPSFAPLKDFSENVYSQYGEDGIVAEALRRLRKYVELDSWCVEFGAWDGEHLSNTCRLIRDEGFSAVLIEGDSRKARLLAHNFPEENVHTLHRFVHFEGSHSLDSILSGTPIPSDFDFLSIDVDGCDYWILEGLERYLPKVICIEINPTIPNSVDFVQPKNFDVKHGSSAKAIVRLAKSKGYSPVAATNCNLILVRTEFLAYVIEEEQELEELYPNGNDATYLFSGYDGSLLSNKASITLPWHGLKVMLSAIQVMPRYLRIFQGDYGRGRRFLYLLWSYWYYTVHFPKKVIARILGKIKGVG